MATKKPLNVYSVDLKLAATIYVKARSERTAKRLAQKWAKDGYEFDGVDISEAALTSPRLPIISLSPAMTGQGLMGGKRARMELVEENVPEWGEELL
jgi:hypothetical protein